MKIEIEERRVVVDGRIYELKADYEKEMIGRREIAEMLGYKHSDGSPNLTNLYKNNPRAVYAFPNFEIDKAQGNAKPWTRAEVRKWLSIPMWKRVKMYKETQNESNE